MANLIQNLRDGNNFSMFRREEYYSLPRDPQFRTALNILDAFERGERNYVILQGKTQSGKTGVFEALCNLIEKGVLSNKKIEKFYYVTGDNSADVKKRKEESEENILEDVDFEWWKNSDLSTQIKNKKKLNEGFEFKTKNVKIVPNLKNCLVFIDESHYGTKEDGRDGKDGNTLPTWLSYSGINMSGDLEINGISPLKEKNIFIVSCSATPWCEMFNDEDDNKPIVVSETGENYKGFEDFLRNDGILIPMEDSIENVGVLPICREWHNYLQSIEETTGKKKCAIVRIRTDNQYDKFKDIFERYFKVIRIDSKKGRIDYSSIQNKIMKYTGENVENFPKDKYLMFVIKGAYTMGNRIDSEPKDNITIIYDYTATLESVTTTAQGLLGRMCGYRNTDEWKQTRLYLRDAHIDALKDYFINGKKVPEVGKLIKRTKYSFVKINNIDVKKIKIYANQLEGADSVQRYHITDWLKSFEGKKLGSMRKFNFDLFLKKKKRSGTKLSNDIKHFLSEKDSFFEEALMLDNRFWTNTTQKGNPKVERFTTNNTYGGETAYINVFTENNIGKNGFKWMIDLRNENDIILTVVKAKIMYKYEVEEMSTQSGTYKKHSNYCVPISIEKIEESKTDNIDLLPRDEKIEIFSVAE